jgi:hypothetical protein
MAAGTELDKWDRPTVGIKTSCAECSVKLEATGAPAGITMAFAPSGKDPAANPAVLGRYNGWAEARVAVAAGVKDGDYPITLTATAGDFPPVSTTLVVRVVSAGYALSVTPTATVVVAGGGPVSATLRALPAPGLDYDKWIAVGTEPAPAGLTIKLDGTLLSPDPGRPGFITVQAAAGVAVGDYPVTVRGALPGRPDVTTTTVVRVVSPSQDRGSVPAEFAGGTWKAGTVSLLSFWDSHTGQFVGRNGYLAYYTFGRDGSYKLLVYNLKRGPSGCATEVWSEWQGAATFGDGTLEVRPTSGRYKVADACFGNFYGRVASSDELEANGTTSYWAWERDAASGRTYLRVGSDRENREAWNWFERTDAP